MVLIAFCSLPQCEKSFYACMNALLHNIATILTNRQHIFTINFCRLVIVSQMFIKEVYHVFLLLLLLNLGGLVSKNISIARLKQIIFDQPVSA